MENIKTLAVNKIVEELRKDIKEMENEGWEIYNWKTMLEAFGNDSEDIRDNIRYILVTYSNELYSQGSNIDLFPNDDCSLNDEHGDIIQYREIAKEVRKQLFSK